MSGFEEPSDVNGPQHFEEHPSVVALLRGETCHIARAVKQRQVTAVAVCQHALHSIKRLNPSLNAFLNVDESRVLEEASEVDRLVESGLPVGPLSGVPVAVKDNLCTEGQPTTCASRILADYRPPFDATAVDRLRGAHAIILGKTNMDEFGMGSSSEHSAFGNVKNPWDLERSPGGSSGGSAAALASGMSPLALGSDTGGSVRQPASFCNLTAIKPTYGRVSRFGLVSYASSMDQVGPMARSIRDAAALLSVVAGRDPKDATSAVQEVDDYLAACELPIDGMRIGVVRSQVHRAQQEEVVQGVERAVDALRARGAKVVDVALPHAHLAVSAYYVLATSEASSNLARFDGMRFGLRERRASLAGTLQATRSEGFGAEVKRRILLGTYSLSAGYQDAYYKQAQKVRTLICRDYAAALQQCEVLLTPTTPTTPFRLGEHMEDPLSMYLADIYTLPISLAGVPSVATPVSEAGGLPTGVQLTAAPFREVEAIRAAAALEEALQTKGRIADLALSI
ncbi:MAG: Asp-tRNA(Asn)/Glu-tRNA(Gln) amidotransferase subunit GatA [Myxococcota bacterium]